MAEYDMSLLAAAVACSALVPYSRAALAATGDDAAVRQLLVPADLAVAQRDAHAAALLVAAGRVSALEPGLAACRSGDYATLRALVEEEGWQPAMARDAHGSGPLLWAAGGGHLSLCEYLVERCGVSINEATGEHRARRGYSGRTALHWCACACSCACFRNT
jgi:hypothetical protein